MSAVPGSAGDAWLTLPGSVYGPGPVNGPGPLAGPDARFRKRPSWDQDGAAVDVSRGQQFEGSRGVCQRELLDGHV